MATGKQKAELGKQLVSIPTATQKAADKIFAVEVMSVYVQ
jgi:hypothetical protein